MLARACQRFAQLRRAFHDFAVDAKSLGDRRHVHVGTAQVRRSAMIGLASQSGLFTTWARAAFAHSLNLRTSSARSAAFCLSAGVSNWSTAAMRSSSP